MSLSILEPCECVQHQKKAGNIGIQVSSSLAWAQLERIRERGFSGKMLGMLRARAESETFAEHEQRVRPLYPAGPSGVRLDLTIRWGCRRRASQCSREPMRFSRRFVRKWTFRGARVGSKVGKVSA